MIIASITFFLLTAVAMRGGVTNYYIEYFFDRKSSIGAFNSLGMAAGVAGALSVTIFKRYVCKVTLFKWATIVVIVLHLGFFALDRDQYLIALVLSMAANFFHMMVTVLLFSMVPDTVEYGKSALKTAGNAMAMSFAGHLLALKFGIAVGGAMTGWGLAYVGYVANAVQSESALSGIVAIYASGPIVLGFVILALLSRYKLTNQEMTKHAG
jgi:GPH family glycoside/pentoside/hexuronide:cation symporter